jgi:hypothetical protein
MQRKGFSNSVPPVVLEVMASRKRPPTSQVEGYVAKQARVEEPYGEWKAVEEPSFRRLNHFAVFSVPWNEISILTSFKTFYVVFIML